VLKLSLQEAKSLSFIRHLREKLEKTAFAEILILMRLIWLRRISYVFRKCFDFPTNLIQKAKRIMEELENANS